MKKLILLPVIFLTTFSFSQPVKKVLMEEFTTVLCGACPPATYALNQFHQSTPNSILVTLHEGFGRDSMSNNDSYAIYNAFKPSWGSFAPAIMVERTIYPSIDTLPYMSTFTSGYDTLVTNALQEPPIVDIQISSQYMPGIGGILATVTSTFIDPLPAGNYRVNLFLVEDSVVGVGYPGYAQKCYDANFVAQHYPGYPYANDTISGYPHRYVFRKSLSGNAMGTNQTVPVLTSGQSPVVGTSYVYTMSTPFILPFSYNFDRLYLVASVNQYQAGSYSGNEVINAQIVKLSENVASGIASGDEFSAFNVYPNPAIDEMNISFSLRHPGRYNYSLTDITGRTVLSGTPDFFVEGNHILHLQTTGIVPGVYTFCMEGDKERMVAQVVIVK